VATTDQEMLAIDLAQYEAGRGPCLDVLGGDRPIVVEDVSGVEEEAWRQFAEAAELIGVRSSLSMPLDLQDADGLAGSLNLYSRQRWQQSEDQIRQAGLFAAQLAAAMQSIDAYRSAARLAAGLAEAMRSRATIEQAKGILMARHGINAQEAFELLARSSQNENRKLREVARQLVEQAGQD
jgi:GAF domain-containing protein